MHRIESTNVDDITDVGKNLFKNGPPATTLNAEWCNSVQEELAYIVEQSGLQLETKAGDSRTQLWQALRRIVYPYQYIVSSQEQFNALIERTGANTYRYIDGVTSIFFKYVEGGYAVAGGSSFLSGGDTWGELQSNACKVINCETGTYFNSNNSPSSFTFNTLNGVFENFEFRYDGNLFHSSVAGGMSTIKVTAKAQISNILVQNPYHQNATTYTAFTVGTGNATNCTAKNLKGSTGASTTRGFNSAAFLLNCLVDTIEVVSGGAGTQQITGFQGTLSSVNCKVIKISGTGVGGAHAQNVYGFFFCSNAINCSVDELTGLNVVGTTGDFLGFVNSDDLFNCDVVGYTSCVMNQTGFSSCDKLTSCRASSMSTTIGKIAYGYSNCTQLENCEAFTIQTASSFVCAGYKLCHLLTNCRGNAIGLAGSATLNAVFLSCGRLLNCTAQSSVNGFRFCSAIQNGYALSNVSVGFASCWPIWGCRASQNGSAYGVSTFADWGGTSAVADTAVGGWNA